MNSQLSGSQFTIVRPFKFFLRLCAVFQCRSHSCPLSLRLPRHVDPRRYRYLRYIEQYVGVGLNHAYTPSETESRTAAVGVPVDVVSPKHVRRGGCSRYLTPSHGTRIWSQFWGRPRSSPLILVLGGLLPPWPRICLKNFRLRVVSDKIFLTTLGLSQKAGENATTALFQPPGLNTPSGHPLASSWTSLSEFKSSLKRTVCGAHFWRVHTLRRQLPTPSRNLFHYFKNFQTHVWSLGGIINMAWIEVHPLV